MKKKSIFLLILCFLFVILILVYCGSLYYCNKQLVEKRKRCAEEVEEHYNKLWEEKYKGKCTNIDSYNGYVGHPCHNWIMDQHLKGYMYGCCVGEGDPCVQY